MIILSCSNIKKYYGIDLILNDISFSINQGDKIGLIGRNGAGKTTLFNILTSNLNYDEGNIYLSKDVNMGYLEQIVETDSADTVFEFCVEVFNEVIQMENELRQLENDIALHSQNHTEPPQKLMDQYSNLLEIFNASEGYEFKSKIRGMLKGLGFMEEDFDKPISQLSGGQRSRLNVVKLLLQKPGILLLDEPTNHLDINATRWLEGYLSGYDGTVIVISHDRYFLDRVTNRTFEVENGKILDFDGNYSAFIKYKKSLHEHALRKYNNQQKEIEKQEELIRRFKQHGTEKLAKRARSREKALEKIEVVDKPMDDSSKAKIKLSTRIKSGYEVLKVDELSKAFGEKKLFNHVSFDIYKEDKIGLIGPNGIGKTTLFRILMNQIQSDEGSVKVGHQVNVGYYDQELSNLNYTNDLVEEISDENPKLSNTEIRTLLGSFLFHGDEVFKKIENLSGGEKARVSLLKLMLSESNMLLLDEPTNHLDISAKEALEDAMADYDGTILAISHDRYFLNKTCNKIFQLTRDGVNVYLGNYDYYIEKTEEFAQLDKQDPAETVQKTKTQIRSERKKEKEQQVLNRKLKKEQDNLEHSISNTEHEIHELENLLCMEEVYSNPEKSRDVTSQLNQLKANLETLYEQWEAYM